MDGFLCWHRGGSAYLISFGPFQPVSVIGVAWKWVPNSLPEWEERRLSQQTQPGSLGQRLAPPPSVGPEFCSRSGHAHAVIGCGPQDALKLGGSLSDFLLRRGAPTVYRSPVALQARKPISKSNGDFLLSSYYYASGSTQMTSPSVWE